MLSNTKSRGFYGPKNERLELEPKNEGLVQMIFLFKPLRISGSMLLNFPGYKRHFMLLTFVCWWRATPLAGGICTHIGPQVYWRSLTDFWGRVLFQQKPFKCFSVTGLLNYQEHDIGGAGGTSVLLLEDDPASFWGGKGLFSAEKIVFGEGHWKFMHHTPWN